MLVSIITPIYKSQDYIEACARSLFEQTYRDIEYIFVDDAGGDNSIPILEKIIKDYPQRHDQVKIIHHDNNRGSAMARESGMMAAHGDYIIHVDSDDTVSPLFIEHLVKAVIENDADVAICNIATTNKTSAKFTIISFSSAQSLLRKIYTFLIILICMTICRSCLELFIFARMLLL